jgi:flagellar biosynthesis protein FlgN
VDPELCRQHLAELLSEEIALLGELHRLLEEEQGLISAAKPEALQRTTRARQERLGALARVEEQRRSLCSLHSHSSDREGLERLRRWCDPKGTLTMPFKECAALAMRCRDLNDRNGVMVAAKMKRVSEALQTLTGRPASADTYGPRGYTARSHRGRILGAV